MEAGEKPYQDIPQQLPPGVKSITLKWWLRNGGASWGLEFPYVYGFIHGLGSCIWHRHTGEVRWVKAAVPNVHGYDTGMNDAARVSQPKNYGWVDHDSVA